MIEWGVLASYMVCGALLAMMAIGVAFSAFMPALDRWNRRYFIAFFSRVYIVIPVRFYCRCIVLFSKDSIVSRSFFPPALSHIKKTDYFFYRKIHLFGILKPMVGSFYRNE